MACMSHNSHIPPILNHFARLLTTGSLPIYLNLPKTALASTVVPVHSDASTFTSITTSPVDPPESLDPSLELKIPLSYPRPSTSASQDAVDDPEGKDEPDPGTTFADGEILQRSNDSAGQDGNTALLVQIGPPASDEAAANGPDMGATKENTPKLPMTPIPIRLIDVRDTLQLEKHHRSRALSICRDVNNLVMECGVNGRLLSGHPSIYQGMADCYQTGDSEGFANLYHAWENLTEACAGHTLHQAPDKALQYQMGDQDLAQPVPWIEEVPEECQDCLLDFLTTLRNDPCFFADRLSSLPALEFVECFGRSTASQKPQSIFGTHPSRRPGARHLPSSNRTESSSVNGIRHFYQDDPFFVLFHCLFDSSYHPNSGDHLLRGQIWSTACARVISEEKTGSDDFVMKTLDTFCNASPQGRRSGLEHFISRILQEGAFLLDSSPKEPLDFKEPSEIRNANAAIAASNFFDKALKDLLAMLLDGPGASILPEGVLDFVSSTLSKVSNSELRSRAKNFIAS
ncbi:MAG: hypothetical protein Q9222_006290, partial [Ikaeria aurantiellina]